MIETIVKDGKTYARIEDLRLWDQNPRGIKKEDFNRLKEQVKKLGQYKPLIVTSEGLILGGNMRYRVYLELNFPDCWISLIEFKKIKDAWRAYIDDKEQKGEFKSEDQAIFEYALSDNDQAGYYEELQLAELINKNQQIDLSLYKADLGKSMDLQSIFDQFRPTVEDELNIEQELKAIGKPKSKVGEIYELGPHRLICGDSTDPKIWDKLMRGEKAKVLFTSPPYNMAGVMYENYADDLKSKEYIEFNLKVATLATKHLKGFLFWNISYNKNARWEFWEIMHRLIKDTGFNFLELIIWDKGHGIPITSKEMLTRQYENILLIGDPSAVQQDLELFYVGSTEKRAWFNKKLNKGITNYWRITTGNTQIENLLACYPVKLPARGMQLTSEINDIVVDPFGGSGTTIIAAEQLNRRCFMIELDPSYCDIIRKRYFKFKGQEQIWDK